MHSNYCFLGCSTGPLAVSRLHGSFCAAYAPCCVYAHVHVNIIELGCEETLSPGNSSPFLETTQVISSREGCTEC